MVTKSEGPLTDVTNSHGGILTAASPGGARCVNQPDVYFGETSMRAHSFGGVAEGFGNWYCGHDCGTEEGSGRLDEEDRLSDEGRGHGRPVASSAKEFPR